MCHTLIACQVYAQRLPLLMVQFTILAVLFVCTLPALAVNWSSPITISSGGTYSGNWRSTNRNTPAITINTSQPVTIHYSRVKGPGTLIRIPYGANANVTIQHVYGYGVNPNVYGVAKGRFIEAETIKHLAVEYCDFRNTRGIYVNQYVGGYTGSSQTIRVRYNRAVNIDGRWSNGSGGYLTGASQYDVAQFCQINNCANVPDMQIAYNEIVNEPYQSRPEDCINIINGGGASYSLLNIYGNMIYGSYPALPGSQEFYGGGIMVDYRGNYTAAYCNTVIAVGNYGIAVAGGHDNAYSYNNVVCSGHLFDGTYIYSSNVGGYVWDCYSDGSSYFYNNQMHDNSLGLVRHDSYGNDMRSDMWFAHDPSFYSLNTSIPGSVTQDSEIQAFADYRWSLIQNWIWVGPTFPDADANLVMNGGFENGNNFWSTWGNATAVNNDARTGSWSMRVGTAGGGRVQRVRVWPNTQYTLRAAGKMSTAAGASSVGAKCFRADGTEISGATHQVAFSAMTTYTYPSVTFTTPSDVSYVEVFVWKDGTNNYFYADDISLN